MHDQYKINDAGDVAYITLNTLEDLQGIRHGFSVKENEEKSDAEPLNFVSPLDRRRFMKELGLPSTDPAMVRQIHSDRVLTIDKDTDPSLLNKSIKADAMITRVKGIPMALLTADCLPLLLVNREAGAAGIAHAGRRGTRQGIAAKTVQTMREEFGARPESTLAAFGPAIGPCCYEVGGDVADGFSRKYEWWEKILKPGRDGRFYLDLFLANRIQLMEAGIEEGNIIEPGLCTSCQSSLFYSYRKEGVIKGHIMSFIMLD